MPSRDARPWPPDIDRHLAPRIGNVRVVDLTTGAIEQKVIHAMHREGLSPSTIRRAVVLGPVGNAEERLGRSIESRSAVKPHGRRVELVVCWD